MPDSASSIVAIKTAFLAAQVKLLNRPLQLVDHASFAQTIPARELKNALKEANRLLRRHNKSIYHQLAIRSVAEQIDTLYWDADATEEDANNDGAGVRIDDDLTSSPIITKLAENAEDSPEFSERLQRLKALSDKRDGLVQKVRLYKAVQNRLDPLKTPLESIQPHLVAREGLLADELAKAKSLGIRLTGRVARLKHGRRKAARFKSPVLGRLARGQHDQLSIIHQELARRH